NESFWMDIGRPEDYVQAQEKFNQMRNLFLPGDVSNVENSTV
ncbi:hypothetical protein MHK_007712, partial [Candidatus Magnetomorum sp. HK-1]